MRQDRSQILPGTTNMTPHTPQPRESGHTPGPWTAKQGEIGDAFWYVDSPTAGIVHVTLDNAAANARLIASAPELLEALERIVGASRRYFEDQDYGRGYTGPTPLEQAKAAIAKATGAERAERGAKP